MQKIKIAFFFTSIFALLLISGCDKEAPFPDESYTGLNNLACYVNGTQWVSQTYKKSDKFRILVGYDNAFPELGFSLIGNNHRKDRDQSILFESAPLDTFELDNFPKRVPMLNGVYEDFISDELFATDGTGPYIEFTRFDTTLRIISGRFEFEAKDEFGGNVLITDGIFDVSY